MQMLHAFAGFNLYPFIIIASIIAFLSPARPSETLRLKVVLDSQHHYRAKPIWLLKREREERKQNKSKCV